jgi:hypothetical protein
MNQWLTWHDAYEDDTPLRHRLRVVQARIRDYLAHSGEAPVRVISMCAGDGRDLLEVLAEEPPGRLISGRLVELDPVLAERARSRASDGIEVLCADAGLTSAYAGAVPANLLLVCGVFGNIPDVDIERTVRSLPSLAAPGAVAIWTRHRRPPDRTVEIRRWFEEAGFRQVAFDAPTEFQWTVGVNRLARPPDPFVEGLRLFSFER